MSDDKLPLDELKDRLKETIKKFRNDTGISISSIDFKYMDISNIANQHEYAFERMEIHFRDD